MGYNINIRQWQLAKITIKDVVSQNWAPDWRLSQAGSADHIILIICHVIHTTSEAQGWLRCHNVQCSVCQSRICPRDMHNWLCHACVAGNSNTFINVDNVDQAGSLIVAVNASSSGDCAIACALNAACTFTVYIPYLYPSGNSCFLKITWGRISPRLRQAQQHTLQATSYSWKCLFAPNMSLCQIPSTLLAPAPLLPFPMPTMVWHVRRHVWQILLAFLLPSRISQGPREW